RFAFAPLSSSEEATEAVVQLETNEKNSSRTVRLLGRGVPPGLSCAPAPIEFGNVVRGNEMSLTVVCSNPLNTTLELASATFFGSSEKYFSITIREKIEDVVVIAPGGEVTLDLVFRAETLGPN